MRILILGGNGMLGHRLYLQLSRQFDTYITLRTSGARYERLDVFKEAQVIERVDATDLNSLVRALAHVRPQVVINCIGIVKQLKASKDPILSLKTNALLPHELSMLCQASNARLIHISTDCVFSGKTGGYLESDISDAEDLYGRSKYLGEVVDGGCLTLRTSIIGREMLSRNGLVEWFLGNKSGVVQGYSRAVFSGVTTHTLARIIETIIVDFPKLTGLYHVSADPISKYDLLSLIREIYDLPVHIEKYEGVVIDRSLNSDRFWSTLNASRPAWPEMLQEMYEDNSLYNRWRQL